MVVPLSKSVKVVAFIEEALMPSEKLAVGLAVGATPVALAPGDVPVTLGAAASAVHSAAWQAPAEQSLRL